MKKIVFLSLLVLGFSSVGYSEPLVELGKVDIFQRDKWYPSQGMFLNGNLFEGSFNEGEQLGLNRNYEGLFYVDTKGYTVIGGKTERENLKKGDLVVTGDIYVDGEIYNEASFELQSECIDKKDLKSLQEKIRLLEQKFAAFEKK